MTIFTTPTAAATAEFVEWLRYVLRSPESAERHAASLIASQDWDSSLTVEVRGFYTQSGNPITYGFSASDMESEEVDW